MIKPQKTIWGAGIAGLVLGAIAMAGLFLYSKNTEKVMTTQESAPVLYQPGMAMLEQYGCRYAEEKIVIINGTEDNYSPAGEEPARMHQRLGDYESSYIPQRDYDDGGLDRNFIDYFELPVNISSGIFVIGLRPLGNNNNDLFSIGSTVQTGIINTGQNYGLPAAAIRNDQTWVGQSGTYRIGFDEMIINVVSPSFSGTPYRTVLEFIQNGTGTQIVDFAASDDTQVDFAAVAICQKPAQTKGLTYLAIDGSFQLVQPGVHMIKCDDDSVNSADDCDPFKGDVSCDTPLPVACLNDLGLPVPDKFAEDTWYWSGGDLALTEKRRGDSFKTIAAADAYCRSQLGAEWRVASFHDGARRRITSSRPIKGPKGRVWIDIKDQSYATCWGRNEAAEARP